MRQILWFGVVLISLSLLFFIPLFVKPDIIAGSLILILGISCVITGFYPLSIYLSRWMILSLAVCIGFAIILVPFPYSIGLIVFEVGVILQIIRYIISKNNLLIKISSGVMISGIIMIVQMTLLPVYIILTAQYHRVDILSSVISVIGSIFGLDTSVNNGVLFVSSSGLIYSFTTTTEKLGFFVFFTLTIASVFIVSLSGGSKQRRICYIICFIIISIIYLLLRYIILIFIYINRTSLDIFYDSFFVFLSFLPLALILMRFIPLSGVSSSEIQIDVKLKKTHSVAMMLIFISVFSVVGACIYQDPGNVKEGRILIDEYHSEWADTTKPFDTEWYGTMSTYNYYSYAEWLKLYYPVEINTQYPLDKVDLDAYDILLLKCPTIAYSDAEIQAIVKFVDRGGGLYLIGDHTNVFGMNTYLNQVSEEFGIHFNTDATYELGTGAFSTYQPDPLFHHTIMQHVKQFDFLTSCTLDAPILSEYVIIGNRLIAEPGTYATEYFFRESMSSPDADFGLLIQVVARKYGSGRVVAFTDSTCFSNFCLFTDGYTHFNLGVIEYLNRENRFSFIPILLVFTASLCFLTSIFLLRRERQILSILILFLFVGSAAFTVATPVFSHLNKIYYPLPVPRVDYQHLSFDIEHSSGVIYTKPRVFTSARDNEFGTFFIWTQRLGCIPSLESNLEYALEKGDAVIIINPDKSFSVENQQAILDYISHGGRILVLDSIFNKNSTANQLIERFNMSIVKTPLSWMMNVVNDSRFYLSIVGGQQVDLPYDIGVTAAVVEIDNAYFGVTGKVIVVVDSVLFSDTRMGNMFIEPDEYQKRLYDTQFYIFREVLLP